MPACPQYGDRPVVLLTNDDGPPSASSPFIYGFSKLLQGQLGWGVRVVVPDCQKSWVGKAYAIADIITVKYFYPLGPDGLTGDISEESRPLRDGETMEWVLVSGTPATCANIALHNLYPGEIDMVVSGPNYGRNSSTAFALSSGTIGAALASALAVPLPGPNGTPSLHADHIPAIALSYGVIARPTPPPTVALAHETAVGIVNRLWNDWGYESGPGASRRKVQVYTVNVPLKEEYLEKSNRRVCWTTMWRNSYGQLFKQTTAESSTFTPDDDRNKSGKGVNEPTSGKPAPGQTPAGKAGPGAAPPSKPATPTGGSSSKGLRFQFAPTMVPLLTPNVEDLEVGTDGWAFAKGYCSVTPIRAEFGGLLSGGCGFQSEDGKEQVYGELWAINETASRM